MYRRTSFTPLAALCLLGPALCDAQTLVQAQRNLQVLTCLARPGAGDTEVASAAAATPSAPALDLSPIASRPEPVGDLHPTWRWLKEKRVRGIWGPGDLFVPYPGRDVSVAEVLDGAGFNLVLLTMGVDRAKRSSSPDLETRLPKNLEIARRFDLPILVKWQYGSAHEEPYRRFRESGGREHDRSCCPLDEDYIERHIGRWALRAAEGGAGGFVIDTEMYESDSTAYPGPCFCDACFEHYLRAHSTDWRTRYDAVEPGDRGTWIAAAHAIAHYSQHAARRIEHLYDGIRARCQAVNPAFLFGYAPLLEHIPGLTRGMGTPRVPCLVFSEGEYTNGPGAQTWANVRQLREAGLPGLYISGHMILYHQPAPYAGHALMASLHADGWWAWFGGALTMWPGADDPMAHKSPYGRAAGTSAAQYLDLLAQMHGELDGLLEAPMETWPQPDAPASTPEMRIPRRDGDIVLDGRLDDAPWQTAARLELSRTRHDEPVTDHTLFRLCHDDDALYVAVTCDLPEGMALQVPQRGRDNPKIWEFDGVEIFLAPGQSTRRYAQFMVSALGDVCDVLVDKDAGLGVHGTTAWSTDVRTATHAVAGRYALEIHIPFADLGPAPGPGERWNANFYRFSPQCAAWSPTFGGFHSPTRFGTLVFE